MGSAGGASGSGLGSSTSGGGISGTNKTGGSDI
jgi:hypothetical protein